MSTLKTYTVQLEAKLFFTGTVDANSNADAVARTFHIWTTHHPQPFEQTDEELLTVTAEEVRS
jgi:hypothetical protein